MEFDARESDAEIEVFSLDRDEIICDNSQIFIKEYIAYRHTIGYNHGLSCFHYLFVLDNSTNSSIPDSHVFIRYICLILNKPVCM